MDVGVEFGNVARAGGHVHLVNAVRKKHSGLIFGALEVVVVLGPGRVDARRSVQEERTTETAPNVLRVHVRQVRNENLKKQIKAVTKWRDIANYDDDKNKSWAAYYFHNADTVVINRLAGRWDKSGAQQERAHAIKRYDAVDLKLKKKTKTQSYAGVRIGR